MAFEIVQRMGRSSRAIVNDRVVLSCYKGTKRKGTGVYGNVISVSIPQATLEELEWKIGDMIALAVERTEDTPRAILCPHPSGYTLGRPNSYENKDSVLTKGRVTFPVELYADFLYQQFEDTSLKLQPAFSVEIVDGIDGICLMLDFEKNSNPIQIVQRKKRSNK